MRKYIEENKPLAVMCAIQIILIALLCMSLLIQTAARNVREDIANETLSNIRYCFDYSNNVIYVCHVVDDGAIVLDRDRDGNNLVVGVINEQSGQAVG